MKFRFIMNFIFIILLILVLFSFAMFQGGFTSWFLFFSFLPIFLYQMALMFYSIKMWQVTRELSKQRIEAGDQVIVKISIRRKIPFPLYYCIFEEIFPESLNKIDLRQDKYKQMNNPDSIKTVRQKKSILFPWFKREFTLTYPLTHLPRGEHILSEVRIRTGDIFGLIKKDHTFQTVCHLTVLPSRRKLFMEEKASNLEQGMISSPSIHFKNTNVVSGIREYMPGDRFSWIDWKQTARKNEVMTKEFEQEKSTDTLLVLDSTYYPDLNELAFEATVELSLSFIDLFKKNGTSANVLTIGEEMNFFPAKRFVQKEAIERHLTTIQPSGSKAFPLLLKEGLMRWNNQHLIIILTTTLDESLQETIKQLKMRRKRVHLIYIQAKQDLTPSGQAIIKHLTQINMDVNLLTEDQLIKDRIGVKSR